MGTWVLRSDGFRLEVWIAVAGFVGVSALPGIRAGHSGFGDACESTGAKLLSNFLVGVGVWGF